MAVWFRSFFGKEKDAWKNELLMQLSNQGIPVVKFVDDIKYKIWGAPLFNNDITKGQFSEYFQDMLEI